MKQVTIQVPDKKYPFFIELVNSLSFTEKKENDTDEKEQILSGIREAVTEVKQIKAGKKKVVLLKDFLNEL